MRQVEDEKQGDPIIHFPSQAAWEEWLEANHTVSNGLWVKIAKKGSGIDTVDYQQALEGALCYGWIDGQKGAFDETYFLQRFTPRRKKSRWSQINVNKATELIAKGRMRPAGLAQVEAAKADGRWDEAYGSSRTIQVPDDLQAALDANPAAATTWAGLTRTNRFAILYRLHDAKRPETRNRRLAQFVEMLTEGRTPYPQPSARASV